jgi:hypothetical protein
MAESRKRSSGGTTPSSSSSPSAGDHKDVSSKKPVRKPRTRAREVSAATIAERAYAISLSESCGSPEENWLRAERELLHSA